jgi:hypothetical protein
MNELSKMRMFSLLAETSQKVTNEEMQNAYEDFVKQVIANSNLERDYSTIIRTLNLSRIEITALETLYRYEQEKKCPKICLSTKNISICQC